MVEVTLKEREPRAGYWEDRASAMQVDPATAIEFAEEDRYDFKDYVEAIAGCILNTPQEAALTIGIDGRWGTGKTSLSNLLHEHLEEKFAGYGLRVEVFDAWTRDQDARGSDEFYRWFLGRVYESRSGWRQFFNPTPAQLLQPRERRKRKRSQLLLLASLATCLLGAFVVAQDELPGWLMGVGLLAVMTAAWFSAVLTPGVALSISASAIRVTLSSGMHGMGQWNSPDSVRSKERLAEQALSLSEDVLKRNGQRCVLIVDNLDRCRPKSATEIVEAIDQLTQRVPVIVVLTADLQILARQIADEYRARHGVRMAKHESFGRAFLERIVTVPFTMPLRPLDNPFARQGFAAPVESKGDHHTVPATGNASADFLALRGKSVPAYPGLVGDILRRDEIEWPSIQGPIPWKFSFMAILATVANWVWAAPAMVAAMFASAGYPAAQRLRAIDAKRLPIWQQGLLGVLVSLAQVGGAIFFGSVLLMSPWFVVGGLYFALHELSGLLAGLFGIGSLPAAPWWIDPFTESTISPVIVGVWKLSMWLAIPAFLLVVVVSTIWSRHALRVDRRIIDLNIRYPREEGYEGSPRIDKELQAEIRRNLAQAKEGFDQLPAELFELFGPTVLPTQRNRKRMANRARLLAKIAERRPELQALDRHLLVAWSIVLENGTPIPIGENHATGWSAVADAFPALETNRMTLLRLGCTTKMNMPIRPSPASLAQAP